MKAYYLIRPKSSDFDSQDVVSIFESYGVKYFILCDGANGYGNGLAAANEAVKVIKKKVENKEFEFDFISEVLSTALIDACMALEGLGQSTAVVVAIKDNLACCASAGDSRAYILNESAIDELTSNQTKGRLGGNSVPSCKTFKLENKTILMGSDGLWDFADLKVIHKTVLNLEPELALEDIYKESIKKGIYDDFSALLIKP